MWNAKISKGSVWVVKSINEYDEYYNGMCAGNTLVLILSAYMDENGNRKYTYLKIYNKDRTKINTYNTKINNNNYYIDMDTLSTGDQRSLESYYFTLDNITLDTILEQLKLYFNIFDKKPTKQTNSTIIKNKSNQKCIHKYGIDIFVTESKDVKLSKSNKLILSDNAKNDIVFNSITEEQIRELSDKYLIYPCKAVREIRNRLIYIYRQKTNG